MPINTKKPAMKQTVGAQYMCFADATEGKEYDGTYEADVEKTEVVKSVTIEAKMNFGTIFYLDQIGGSKLGRRIDKLEKSGKATDSDKMNFAAKLIYAMVRSNGRKVTFDEALQLVPPDPTELLEVVEAYQKEVDKIKKKEESKAQMKAFSSR